MVIQMDRRTGYPLWIFGCLLVAIVVALLAYGWCRPAGAWRVEAPGPMLNAPAISAGLIPLTSQLHGTATAARNPGGGQGIRPDPRPGPVA